MVGPTWMRVCLTLGSDCLPALSQRTALLLPRVSWTAYCSHAHDLMIWMIQGCISMLRLSMSPRGLFHTSYSICLHGILYPMMDYYVYDWWRALSVKAPPMVGPTWTRVCLTLGSDCSPPLFQRTILLLLPAPCSIC